MPITLGRFILVFLLMATTARAGSVRHVVVLETMTAPIVQQFTEAFMAGVGRWDADAGFRLNLIRHNALGSQERARRLLSRTLAEHQPDLIVSVATLASKVALEASCDHGIPLVFMCVTDPVGAGLISAIGVPSLTHVTGKAHYIPADTKLEIVRRVLAHRSGDRPIRFGYIYTDYPADMSDFRRLTASADHRDDLVFVPMKIPYRPVSQHKAALLEKVRNAVKHLSDRVDYFWSPRGILAVLPEHDDILLSETDVPLIVGATEESVRKGALLHVTGDPESQGHDVAAIALAILKGAAAGQIPPSLPGKIQFAINLKTASRLQWVIPSDLLALAKGHTYR